MPYYCAVQELDSTTNDVPLFVCLSQTYGLGHITYGTAGDRELISNRMHNILVAKQYTGLAAAHKSNVCLEWNKKNNQLQDHFRMHKLNVSSGH